MRTLIIGACAIAVLAGQAQAASPNADITAPITAFVDAFDKGDLKTAGAQTADSLTIIDEAAPYTWTGPNALSGWAGDLIGGDAKAGIKGESVAISAPSRIEADGDNAYVVVPAVYTFAKHGQPMREAAQMTFALHRGAGGWKIAGLDLDRPESDAGGAVALAHHPAATTKPE